MRHNFLILAFLTQISISISVVSAQGPFASMIEKMVESEKTGALVDAIATILAVITVVSFIILFIRRRKQRKQTPLPPVLPPM